MSRNLMRAIDEDVLTAARAAAEQSAARFVIGWWNDGAQRRVMLLPEGHHVTDEPPLRSSSPPKRQSVFTFVNQDVAGRLRAAGGVSALGRHGCHPFLQCEIGPNWSLKGDPLGPMSRSVV